LEPSILQKLQWLLERLTLILNFHLHWMVMAMEGLLLIFSTPYVCLLWLLFRAAECEN
jgi:hypothetical protein